METCGASPDIVMVFDVSAFLREGRLVNEDMGMWTFF